jgi:LysM repeat protein
MIRRSGLMVLAITSGAVALATPSRAQQVAADQGAGPTQGAAPSQQVISTPVYGGIVAPPPAGQPLGGGNATESSSRAISGDQEDHFDLGQSGVGGGTVYGGSNGGAVFFDKEGAPVQRVGPPPTSHTVKKGDTLWGICDEYFRNPYQWPRIWSYNPQIQNPHWIYPNEQVNLKPLGGTPAAGPQVAMPTQEPGIGTTAPRTVVPNTIFLRDEGFVNDDASLNWGSIVGSPADKMFLSDTDQLYVRVGPEHDVKLGTELTVFRPIRQVNDGQVIAIQGTVRVDDWNPQTRIARAQVVETLDAIERGARVGPLPRRFEIIPPKRNGTDVEAHVAVAVHPHVFYGQNQVVFIDRGAEAGLQPGNRLFVVRKGDQWRKTMYTDQSARRIAGEREEPGVVEATPKMRDDQALPEEVVGELRVLAVQKKSATCMVTASRYEIEPNDLAVARKGY